MLHRFWATTPTWTTLAARRSYSCLDSLIPASPGPSSLPAVQPHGVSSRLRDPPFMENLRPISQGDLGQLCPGLGHCLPTMPLPRQHMKQCQYLVLMNAKFPLVGILRGGRDCELFVSQSLGVFPTSIMFLSHNIWLRDHCRCPECFHPITKQRLLNTFDVGGF